MAACGLKKSDKSIACHPVNIGETRWIELMEKLKAAFGALDSEYMEKLLDERGFELAKGEFDGD